METLPQDALEEFLGLSKQAVAGPAEGEEPTSAQGAELDAKQKAVRQHAEGEHADTPTKRTEMPGNVSHEGDSKAKPVEKEAMNWADGIGRMLAHTHAEVLEKQGFVVPGLVGYYSQGDPEKTPKSGFWRGAGLGTLGAVAGSIPGAMAGHQGLARVGSLAGGVAGGYLGGKSAKLSPAEQKEYAKTLKAKARSMSKSSMGDDEGMETTAAAKAKIASRVLRIARDLPDDYRDAAIKTAGQELAKVGEKTHKKGLLRRMHESSGFQSAGGGLAGGALGSMLSKSKGKGALIGAGLGAAGGFLGSKANKAAYRGIDSIRGSRGTD
jgi:uncharacterized protein YcfJ